MCHKHDVMLTSSKEGTDTLAYWFCLIYRNVINHLHAITCMHATVWSGCLQLAFDCG
jgi:hypothetical protein